MDEKLRPRPANSCPLTPVGFLERAATVYGDCRSIIYNNNTYTWSQTHRRCLQLASSLSSIGLKRGHVVSIVAPNIPAIYELHFAVPMAGAILNTINTRLDPRTVSVLLQHGECKILFVDVLSVPLIREAIALFSASSNNNNPTITPPLLVLIDDDGAVPAVSAATASAAHHAENFYDTYEGLVEKGDPGFRWIRPNNEWDPIVLNYTSGTTSSPKGAVHSHRGAFVATVDSVLNWCVPLQPVFLWTLPMFHSNGWTFTWGMAAVGGTNVCLRKFNGPTVHSLINKHGITHMCGAPVVVNMLLNSATSNLSHSVYILTAGAPPPATILLRAESLGFIVSHGYGLTETGGVVVSCAWKPHWNHFPETERARLKSRQGVRTLAVTEVDVVDPETGVSVKRDGLSRGEIVLRGVTVMLGYLKDPAATSKCMREDGWFYTGDVAVMHPDGYLEIKDRSKEVIISGGENLSSVEVETVLYTNPIINEASVVARPDKFWGETPCAFVSLKKKKKVDDNDGDDDTSDELSTTQGHRRIEKEIIEYCRSRLPHYMVPKAVVVMEELPKTSTGKILKVVLREMAKAMNSSTLSRF